MNKTSGGGCRRKRQNRALLTVEETDWLIGMRVPKRDEPRIILGIRRKLRTLVEVELPLLLRTNILPLDVQVIASNLSRACKGNDDCSNATRHRGEVTRLYDEWTKDYQNKIRYITKQRQHP